MVDINFTQLHGRIKENTMSGQEDFLNIMKKSLMFPEDVSIDKGVPCSFVPGFITQVNSRDKTVSVKLENFGTRDHVPFSSPFISQLFGFNFFPIKGNCVLCVLDNFNNCYIVQWLPSMYLEKDNIHEGIKLSHFKWGQELSYMKPGEIMISGAGQSYLFLPDSGNIILANSIGDGIKIDMQKNFLDLKSSRISLLTGTADLNIGTIQRNGEYVSKNPGQGLLEGGQVLNEFRFKMLESVSGAVNLS